MLCMTCLTGCILADDMGLGKTLQGIALLWTLLTAGHPLLGGNPIAKRIISNTIVPAFREERCARHPARMSSTASSSSAARGTTTRQASPV